MRPGLNNGRVRICATLSRVLPRKSGSTVIAFIGVSSATSVGRVFHHITSSRLTTARKLTARSARKKVGRLKANDPR